MPLLFLFTFLLSPIGCPAESNHKPLVQTSVIELLNGSEGDLAPDSESRKGDSVTQLWNLAPATGAKMLLRCSYKDTRDTITRELPKESKLCTKNLTNSGKGLVSISCQ